ncbi:MAG: PP2C family protein-serine/threonine phosphatase [Pseudanabaenaceae cyanobacterium]
MKLGKIIPWLGLHYRDLTWRQDVAILALLYFFGGWLVLRLPQNDYGSPYWPPVGIALGILLSRGWSRWLGIYCGAISISVFVNHVPLHLALLTGSFPTIGCLISYFLILQYTTRTYPLEQLNYTIIFILTALFGGTILQSLGGVTMGLFLGFIDPRRFWSSLTNWWAGDSIGILVLTPFILSWQRSGLVTTFNSQRTVESAVVTIFTTLVLYLTLVKSNPLEYLLIPPILWAALRLGDKFTTLLIVLVSTLATIATAYGMGVFFRAAEVDQSLVLMQLFLGTFAIMAMTVLSITNENNMTNFILSQQIKLTNAAYQDLDQLNRDLENIVIERTLEIAQLNSQLEAENRRLGSEIEVAQKLQRMILPSPQELNQISVLDIAGFVQPTDEVGGDYFDVLNHNDAIKIGVGDVTGHGLESGVIMIMAQTAIRTLILHGEQDNRKILATLNRTIYDNIQRMQSDRNVSLILLSYQDYKLHFTGQHETIIVARGDGKIEEIDTDTYGFPLGLVEDTTEFMQEGVIPFFPQDVALLYTDGITEAVNNRQEYYGIDRLKLVLQTNRHKSATEIKNSIIADLYNFIDGYTIFDDISLVVVKHRAPAII